MHMKKLTFTTLLATLAAGFALTLSAADKPASCPVKDDNAKQTCPDAKKSCCQAPVDANRDKPKADCCAKPADANCAKDKAACKKPADACPQCAAGKTTAASADANTCPVSGEKLGSMGEPYVHTHKEAGKADLAVSLCCKMCVKAFDKNPAKYLAKLDAK